jgi:glycosyltransferase involved in cell wall biosynthesis
VAEDPHVDLTAIFASTGGIRPIDAGYGKSIAWDIDPIAGFRTQFLRRADVNPIDGNFLAFRDLDVVGQLRRHRFDALWLWGYNYLTHQLAVLTQRTIGSPIIFHEEQNLIDKRSPWKRGLKRIALPLMFRGGKALYIGTENYRWFRHYGVRDEDLYFAPYAVDNDRLQSIASSLAPNRLGIRRAFGIADDAGPVILCVARLMPKKQPLMLLDAFARVRLGRRCTLLMAGSGELDHAIRTKIQRCGIRDVVLTGFLNQSQIPQAYAAADVFVLPSNDRETWGVSVNEAMNFGLPVVVSDKVGCATDLVKEGENGFIVSAGSSAALAERLATLVDSPEMRSRFGSASRERVAGWNYDVAAKGALDAIADAVGTQRWTSPIPYRTAAIPQIKPIAIGRRPDGPSQAAVDSRVRVALFTASPVYTRTPLYQRVAADPRIHLTVIFASNGGVRPVSTGYALPVAWDVDMLAGYESIFLRRAERNPIDGPFLAFRDVDVVSVLARGRYDVLWLWGYNYLSHQLASMTHFLLRRPVIFHENQTLLDDRPPWKRGLKKAGLQLLFRNGRALYVGTENRRWFRHYGLPDDHLFFAPYAVDNERLRAEAAKLRDVKRNLQQAFGIRSSGPVIVAVSRLVAKKEPLLLLEAFRRVRERQECSLLLVGSGELEGSLKRMIEDKRIPDVTIAGFLNQGAIARAYAAADIFALASSARETWGLAVNEAMNFGLPIVVTDKVGCATDLVRDGENGYVVPSQNVVGLADRLAQLVASAETRHRFGQASRKIVDHWNYEQAALGVSRAVADAVGTERWEQAAYTVEVATEARH